MCIYLSVFSVFSMVWVSLSVSLSKSWRVYGRNADAVREALLSAHPELHVVLNPEKPRRNSFEVTLIEGKKGTFTAEHTTIVLNAKNYTECNFKRPQWNVFVSFFLKSYYSLMCTY